MPAYFENTNIDTSSIAYPKTGIRLLKYVKTAYGLEVLEKIAKGDFIVWFDRKAIKFDTNFSNFRVKEDTTIRVRVELKDNVDEDFFA